MTEFTKQVKAVADRMQEAGWNDFLRHNPENGTVCILGAIEDVLGHRGGNWIGMSHPFLHNLVKALGIPKHPTYNEPGYALVMWNNGDTKAQGANVISGLRRVVKELENA